MWRYIFRIKRQDSTEEEFLAPETRPVINSDARMFVVKKSNDYPAEKINYKMIKKRRRDQVHKLY